MYPCQYKTIVLHPDRALHSNVAYLCFTTVAKPTTQDLLLNARCAVGYFAMRLAFVLLTFIPTLNCYF